MSVTSNLDNVACEQQRRRPACSSTQMISAFIICCLESTVVSEIFARILFSRITLEDISAKFKNSHLGHDLPTSINDKTDFAISRGFYIHKT